LQLHDLQAKLQAAAEKQETTAEETHEIGAPRKLKASPIILLNKG
jgi:hypothetical protein